MARKTCAERSSTAGVGCWFELIRKVAEAMKPKAITIGRQAAFRLVDEA